MEIKLIGNKITEARKRLNLSQAQLAERLFISPQAVGKWERGESMPDIITLNRLSEILGVDLNYFSENFQSVTIEMAPVESLVKQSAELPSGKQEKKLSWDMSRGNWVDADFSGLENLHDKFSSSNMQRCKFIGSAMAGLFLKSNHIESCDFSRSDISSSSISTSYLVKNRFIGCTLNNTEFSKSHINQCDFTEANFTGVAFKSASFEKNKVANAVWNHTSFMATAIADVIFNGTVEGCYFENCAFDRVTFQSSTLMNTFFKNKTLKGIRFIDCQADRMTYEFLKNGKADLTGLAVLTP